MTASSVSFVPVPTLPSSPMTFDGEPSFPQDKRYAANHPRQQSVEFRLQSLTDEIATVKAANADLVRQLGDGGGGRSVTAPAGPPSHQTTTTPGSQLDSRPHPLPQHLHGLRDILRPALAELQHPTNLDVAIEDATVLWEQ
jgi:hypothetical protein